MKRTKREQKRNNRNILECKYKRCLINVTTDKRNNRNILECKFAELEETIEAAGGNNRNILECKLLCRSIAPSQSSEIIETYWNVNDISEACRIDTFLK